MVGGPDYPNDAAASAPEAASACGETAVLSVPAEATQLLRVNEFLHAELGRHACPTSVQKQIDVAVEELFVNVCNYAYRDAGPDAARSVRISLAMGEDRRSATLEIADSGAPFDPLARPDAATVDSYEDLADLPIGGLGLLVTKRSVDEISYERADGCNVVTLVKRW